MTATELEISCKYQFIYKIRADCGKSSSKKANLQIKPSSAMTA